MQRYETMIAALCQACFNRSFAISPYATDAELERCSELAEFQSLIRDKPLCNLKGIVCHSESGCRFNRSFAISPYATCFAPTCIIAGKCFNRSFAISPYATTVARTLPPQCRGFNRSFAISPYATEVKIG